MIRHLDDEELSAAGVDAKTLADKNYIKRAATVRDSDLFDASFFGITPREAALTDPQHRLFLEAAWEALESAGYAPTAEASAIGVFAGVATNGYFLGNLLGESQADMSAAAMQMLVGNEKDFLCTRVAYHLNLTGPAVSVQTACSTSLVAVHMACQSIRNGECEMALAGGVSVTALKPQGYRYVEGGVTSRDGYCRAFDRRASGTVGGDGLGVVVLKCLSSALRDGDTVHAVICGSATNNDGLDKIGFTAPSVNGQVAVIQEALRAAGLSADAISYVEAHGTGTVLGDPIEVRALENAFALSGAGSRKARCALGSVKTNIGHLNTAAGVAGLIKTVLSLKHRQIPPTLHYESANPHIDFANSPFEVNATLRAWEVDTGPRRAGVSSFGIGGTNAHVIVEESLQEASEASERPVHVVLLSARTAGSLEGMSGKLSKYLRTTQADLADAAYTSQVGRKHFALRRAVVCRTGGQAADALESRALEAATAVKGPSEVVFLFPGQGSQMVNMGRELYAHEDVFREELDRCLEQLGRWQGEGLRQILFPAAGDETQAQEQLRRTCYAQPALFAVEYALAKQLASMGIEPAAMIGHSVGEYVAACLSGVMSLEEALYVVCRRGQLMESLPGGVMLWVQATPTQLKPLLGEEMWLSGLNAPQLCTVSASETSVGELERRLKDAGLVHQRLQTSHGFHSGLMDPMLASFADCLKGMELKAPQRPYLSNVSGDWITAAEACEAGYWVSHIREPVQFSAGLSKLLEGENRVLLEVGPGTALTVLARQQKPDVKAFGVLPSARSGSSAQESWWEAIAALWESGVEVDWKQTYGQERRRRIPLPSYVFERQRYWIEGATADRKVASAAPERRGEGIDNWFYAPSWKRTEGARRGEPERKRHLVLTDRYGLDQHFVTQLKAWETDVLMVEPGELFEQSGTNNWRLDPRNASHYEQLLQSLQSQGRLPDRITHLLSLTPGEGPVEVSLDDGVHSVYALCAAYQKLGIVQRTQLTVVSNGVHAVTGQEKLYAEKATILGPCQVVPLEQPQIRCRHIDVEIEKDYSLSEKQSSRLVREICRDDGAARVAYRGSYRWEHGYEAVTLERSEVPVLRDNGVYLITGGLGGIGQCFAEYVASTARGVQLVLVGRTPLPAEVDWPRYMADAQADEALLRKLTQIQALRERGAQVRYVAADVAVAADVTRLADALRAEGLSVHGIFHAAGVSGAAPGEANDERGMNVMMAPKVVGTRLLLQAIDPLPLDFVLLCSSMSTVAPIIGHSAYSAANSFLDTVSFELRSRGVNATVVNWSTWQGVGMAVDHAMRLPADLREQQLIYLSQCIGPNDAPALFERILNSGPLPQVIITPVDLESVRIGTKALNKAIATQNSDNPNGTNISGARPLLKTVYQEPANDVEHALAEIWQDLFGIEHIGRNDDFFELGGHSLLATQVVYRVRNAFEIDMPLRDLFELPTIAALAERVEEVVRLEIENMSDLEAQRLVDELNAGTAA
ncbi:polyketide synthase [Dyella sp. GSA-30]|nr:polyketide synthase [Dyella sp. GSA-30]